MLFNSYEFIFLFLPVTLLLYFVMVKVKLTKLATATLIIASLIFYSYWDIRYIPLLVISILFNYLFGLQIAKGRSKRLLYFAISIDLLLLGYYKYTAFLISSINEIVGMSLSVPNIILPLGISFFTFTQVAYLVDAYRGETKNYSFLTYGLFVTFFPHLIAGPILYHKDIIPQFSKLRNYILSYKNMSLGITIFSIGLFKKVIIADALSPWVKLVFDHAAEVTFFEAWLGAIGYTLQLYFDFSGYSEMALGLGMMLNIQLPINFNSPYKATSIIDFWRRWHITLSAFLKNYLYIPLGGNRQGQMMRMRNLFLTMLLGGLWHGAGWTFIAWGGLHGAYLVINHAWRKANIKIPLRISWVITFVCVVIAWVFFRANTISDALLILKTMVGMNGVLLSGVYANKLSIFKQFNFIEFGKMKILMNLHQQIITIFLLMLVVRWENQQRLLQNFYPSKTWIMIVSLLLLASLFSLTQASEFLYFQF